MPPPRSHGEWHEIATALGDVWDHAQAWLSVAVTALLIAVAVIGLASGPAWVLLELVGVGQ